MRKLALVGIPVMFEPGACAHRATSLSSFVLCLPCLLLSLCGRAPKMLHACFCTGSTAQSVTGMLICFLSFGLYMHLHPYRSLVDDRLGQARVICLP